MNWKNSNLQHEQIQSGKFIIGLNRAKEFYLRKLRLKQKPIEDSRMKDVFVTMVDRVMGYEIDEDKLDEDLNIDCLIGMEAREVKETLLDLITDDILNVFPKLGAYVPDDYYWVKMEGILSLIITVPEDYEEQRGIFF